MLNFRSVGALTFLLGAPAYAQSIAQGYPGDAGIEAHADVVFVERFEGPAVADVTARWNNAGDPASMSLELDAPAGSPGTRSLRMTSSATSSGSSLYKLFSPGIDTALHLRYYVKYPAGAPTSSGQIGGYNPYTPWPQGNLTGRPTGSDVFFAWTGNTPALEALLQAGWMGMQPDGAGGFWANQFVPGTNPALTANRWTCIELAVTLNNPVTGLNGELSLWIDGTRVNHLGQGFPNGNWTSATFTNNAAGTPFAGFQWRNDAVLNLNWTRLIHYLPATPGYTQFDHVVLARSYVGPLAVTIPTPPLGLTALPGDSQITLSWNASAGAATYNVLGSAVSGGPYAPVASGITGTAFTVTGLANGTPYFYVVTATNVAGTSGPSNEASATPNPLPPDRSDGNSRCGCGSISTGVHPLWIAALAAFVLVLACFPATRGRAVL